MQYKTQHCSIYFSYVLTFFRFFSFSLWLSFGLRSGRNLVNKKRSLAIAALALVVTLRFCPTICSGGGEGGRGVVQRQSFFQRHDPPRPRTVSNAVGTTQHGLKHGPPAQAIACAFKPEARRREKESEKKGRSLSLLEPTPGPAERAGRPEGEEAEHRRQRCKQCKQHSGCCNWVSPSPRSLLRPLQ